MVMTQVPLVQLEPAVEMGVPKTHDCWRWEDLGKWKRHTYLLANQIFNLSDAGFRHVYV